MLKTVRDACRVYDSTLDYQTAAGVEGLEQVIAASDRGASFLAKSYLTQGMAELLREGLLRLSGQSNQAIFQLAQAMGGGKTHLMATLGLLAKYPEQRETILSADIVERLTDQPAQIAIFDGRTNPRHLIWGEIANQLRQANLMQPFWEQGPKAPDKNDWKRLIGSEPTLILFDELPPYFLNARTISVGQGTLVDVVTVALANLFAAALELPRCCIVLANLADSYKDQVKEIRKLTDNIQQEANRQARTITPVSLEGDEIYQILRKQLFKTLPTEEEITEVAEAYGNEIKLAEQGGYFAARSLEQITDEVQATYPFHPAFKHLVALFKDNPNFRETRGLLQFSARLIRSVWQREQNDVFLIGTQHLNLNDPLVSNEITDINGSLKPAITKDIADQGSSHAEQIDANFNSDAGSQVAALLLSASLSLAVKGHMGLRREEVIEYLVAPHRKPDEFAQAFDRLRKSAWYLHGENDLYYFKDTENLTKRIQREAQALPKARVDRELQRRLEGELEPRTRRAYQEVLVMPEINEIKLSSHRVLVVVPPDNRVPPEDIQRFYESVTEKNHLLVLSGNDTHMASRVEDALRELFAISNIVKTLSQDNSLYAQALEAKEEAEGAFLQALQGTYNRLFYPGVDGLQAATIENGLKFGQTSQDSIESQIEHLLASTRCDEKLAEDVEKNLLKYFSMAEQDLWPQTDRRTPWRDVLMRAKSNPAWPWLPGSKGLENLKTQALAQGRWREGADGYVEKGPFPKEKTEVNIVDCREDTSTQELVITLAPKNAGPRPKIYYSLTPDVSATRTPVEDADTFRTKEPTLYFWVEDSTGQHEPGQPKRWVAPLKIRHQICRDVDGRTVKLEVTPPATLHYSLDGTSPQNGPVYTQPIPISKEAQTLLVYAVAGEANKTEKFSISADGSPELVIDEIKPAKLRRQKVSLDATQSVFNLIAQFKDRPGILFYGAQLIIGEAELAVSINFNARSVTVAELAQVISSLRNHLNEPDALVQLKIRDGADFASGFDLKDFARMTQALLTPDTVEQD